MAVKLERQINLTNLSLGSLDIGHSNAVQGSQNSENEDVIATTMNGGYNGRRNNNVNAKCTFCGMVGHTVDRCYKKHGYPPRWVLGFKSKGKQVTTTVTNNVGDLGITSEQLQKIASHMNNYRR